MRKIGKMKILASSKHIKIQKVCLQPVYFLKNISFKKQYFLDGQEALKPKPKFKFKFRQISKSNIIEDKNDQSMIANRDEFTDDSFEIDEAMIDALSGVHDKSKGR